MRAIFRQPLITFAPRQSYQDIDDVKSLAHLHEALSLAKTATDKNVLLKKIQAMEG